MVERKKHLILDFRLITIYVIWLYRNIIDNGVIPGFLVVFFVVRWLFMFVVWITDCAFWNNTALWWIFGIIFICCFGVFEVSLPRLFFPHVSCQRRITPTFPVCQGFSLEKPSGHWASPWNPTVQASINIPGGESSCVIWSGKMLQISTFLQTVIKFSNTTFPHWKLLRTMSWHFPLTAQKKPSSASRCDEAHILLCLLSFVVAARHSSPFVLEMKYSCNQVISVLLIKSQQALLVPSEIRCTAEHLNWNLHSQTSLGGIMFPYCAHYTRTLL